MNTTTALILLATSRREKSPLSYAVRCKLRKLRLECKLRRSRLQMALDNERHIKSALKLHNAIQGLTAVIENLRGI